MNVWRRELARPAIEAARNWTFNIPQTGEEAHANFLDARIPVNFVLGSNGEPSGYGQWDAYVPGPVQQIPWKESSPAAIANADAIPNNGLAFQDDPRFVLLNPPGNG